MNPSSISSVAVVYHSGYGHTAKQAQAIARGVDSIEGVKSALISVEQIDAYWDILEDVDGIIFGAPTYMGSASAQFKTFMDASSSKAFLQAKWAGKVAAGFTNAAAHAGDKLATLQQLAIFAAQHGMHWINLGLQAGNNHSGSTEDSLNRDGFFLGAAAQSNADQGAELVPPAADLRTAEYLGARVARVAWTLAAGLAAANVTNTASNDSRRDVRHV